MLSDDRPPAALDSHGPLAGESTPADSGRPIAVSSFQPPAPVQPGAAVRATIEVLLCSGFPTQILVIQLLAAAGFQPTDDTGRLSLGYVWTLSMTDALLLVGLVLLLLRINGEEPGRLLLGDRRLGREALLGILITPFILFATALLLFSIQRYVPWLHNVPENPLADLLRTPRDTWIFISVAIIAGGVREEVQRAFILRRFEQHLGGAVLGLILFSLAFGLGHLLQGRDVAIVTVTLGAIWGVLYLRRRSIVAPAVSHAVFNVSQIAQHVFFS